MRESYAEGVDSRRFRELGDPEFITLWADLRRRLFFTPREEPEYSEIKDKYDAAAVELRRRMSGGLALPRRKH